MAPLVWLITGCSSGFGEQFVHQALARGDKVIATGRNAATKLKHLESTGAAILDLDISITTDEITAKVNQALSIYDGIDILINNAGYIESSALEELTPDRLLRSFQTNVFGPVNVTRAVLPHMREKKSGTIVFVGSQAGWQGEASATGYAASKFAQEGIVECLQKELPMFGIRTIIFEPGFFRTKALSQQNIRHEQGHIPAYAEFNKAVLQYETAVYGNEPGDPVKAVARMIEVVTGTGMASGKELPPRLPLGSDGLKVLRDKCRATLQLLDEWEDLIVSTDIAKSDV
ncbi:putative hydroxybutyrate dehydrogenase [Xylogone sp. PMI_703]|nr:putative hydroxybutyrate dehydrogenase [Xylogone sp. PMI_703]